ncbi:ABC transporter ATP-binding protein [Sporosarcina saromensis]|uniref:ABC transporter ATP-binding protein n=1 Tax=Sporosarcina saromensis TaxID=359365 RepID=A0ABU4GCC8_9BACL|nr:ABC transporter ATP-binding protein [Sporosarcina saromensis]MDW0114646.1 ABC transporter ATP-binding protein [Sporosarcina saromensis]
MESIVEVSKLTKNFKDVKAVDNVSFSIKRGGIVAFLGPNGAGKSTTILMLLGLLNPTYGNVKLFNEDPKIRLVRERIGVMMQHVSLMDAVKVRELLALFKSYYSNSLSMEQLINITGLSGSEVNKRTEKLSGGQRQRVGFALALVGNPDLLFFDEPTVGMDSTSRKMFWDKVRELAKEGKTIIFSTHYLQEADDVATRILLFKNGKIAADGSPESIKRNMLKQTVSFKVNGPFMYREKFLKMTEVIELFEKKGRVTIVTENSDVILSKLFTDNISVSDISVDRGSLEDAFVQLTTEEDAHEHVH